MQLHIEECVIFYYLKVQYLIIQLHFHVYICELNNFNHNHAAVGVTLQLLAVMLSALNTKVVYLACNILSLVDKQNHYQKNESRKRDIPFEDENISISLVLLWNIFCFLFQ